MLKPGYRYFSLGADDLHLVMGALADGPTAQGGAHACVRPHHHCHRRHIRHAQEHQTASPVSYRVLIRTNLDNNKITSHDCEHSTLDCEPSIFFNTVTHGPLRTAKNLFNIQSAESIGPSRRRAHKEGNKHPPVRRSKGTAPARGKNPPRRPDRWPSSRAADAAD
ncbi:hypothetical protein EVAR_19117_1 [Eumeta japonica]|uniref:Uncharacterized protein n=1 Tax=Eumeta variegata TaxID=151549 RepID=A0A4C1UQK5_EUMVA|nr:hypothetical protein EVAR_19117_1 [Eumeta japonica]